jgi:hypothetical protein
MSLNKGKKAERDVANYLTANGIPARRSVRTGDANHHDTGDIEFEGVCIEVKNWAGDLTIGSVETLLAKLAHQKPQNRECFGLLVDRLDRVADPGKWRVWMTAHDALFLLTGYDGPGSSVGCAAAEDTEPVSVRLAYVVHRLKVGGWVRTVVNPFGSP